MTYEVTQDNGQKQLANRFGAAFEDIFGNPDQEQLTANFVEAYHYRSQFPWLYESSSFPGSMGLSDIGRAIGSALVRYDYSAYASTSTSLRDVSDLIDLAAWQSRLATAEVEAAGTTLTTPREHFRVSLEHSGIIISQLDDQTFGEHVTRALHLYATESRRHTTSDPW